MNWKEKYPQWVTKNGGIKPQAPLEIRQEVFIERSKEIHNNKYDYSQVVYLNNSTKVVIVCPTHGPWDSVPNNHVTFKNGCRECADSSMLKTVDQFIEQAMSVHGNKYDYSLAEYVGAHRKLVILCKHHGKFLQAPHEHIKGNGCPLCIDRSISNIVYIFSEAKTNNYKIGITCDIKERKRRLENGCSFELTLIAYKKFLNEQEARDLERKIHALEYENPYSEAAFDGYTEWRTINQHDLEILIASNGFTVAP